MSPMGPRPSSRRDVGHVFPCGALGILDPQPDLLRDTGGIGRQERSQSWRSGERQAPERSPGVVTGGSQARSHRDAVSRPASGFPHGSTGNPAGRNSSVALMDCDFQNGVLHIPYSYYWRRGGHLKDTKTEGSAKPLPMQPALQNALLEWRTLSCYRQDTDFVF